MGAREAGVKDSRVALPKVGDVARIRLVRERVKGLVAGKTVLSCLDWLRLHDLS